MKNAYFTHNNIYRLHLGVLLALGLVCGGLTAFYFYEKKIVRKQVEQQLADTVDERSHKIGEYVQRIINFGIKRAQNKKIITALEKLSGMSTTDISSTSNKKFIASITLFLEEASSSEIYRNNILIDNSGRVVFSDYAQAYVGINILENKDTKYAALSECYTRAKMTITPDVSSFEYDSILERPALFTCIPVFKNNSMIGILALEIPTKGIYNIVEDYIELGTTGEVILGKKVPNGVIYTSKTRFDLQEPFKLFFHFPAFNDEFQVPMLSAALGNEGKGIKYDHIHKKTIAAWQYVPKVDWGIVAKIDLTEVDDSLWWLWIITLLASSIFILFFCITGYRYTWFSHIKNYFKQALNNAKIRSAFKIILLLANVILLAKTLYSLNNASEYELKKRKSDISHNIHETLNDLTHSLNGLQIIGQAIANDLNIGVLKKEDLITRIKHDLKKYPILYGIEVGFQPYAYSKDKRLFAPYVTRNKKGSFDITQVEESFDYTEQVTDIDRSVADTWAWYNEPLKENKLIWFNPYKDILTRLFIAGYSLPFYDPSDIKHEKPIGVLNVLFDVGFIQDRVFQLDGITPGYVCLLSDTGTFIYQTDRSYIIQQKTIFNMARELSSKKLLEIGKQVLQGKQGYFAYDNKSTHESMWAYFETEPTTKWVLGLMFSADEVQLPPLALRHYYITIALYCLLILFVLLWILGPSYISNTSSYSYILSVILFITLAILFFIIRSTPIFVTLDQQLIIDQMHLQSLLHTKDVYAQEVHETSTIKIPFGLEINSAYLSEGAFLITGYAWEKYPKNIDKKLIKPPQFPDAITKVNIDKTYEEIDGDTLIIGWQFNTKLGQQFDFSKYPLDIQNITIEVEHPDFSKNIMLIPSFNDYHYIQPEKLPGIYQDFSIPGYILERTFFSFNTETSNNTMGLKSYENINSHLWLSFNITLVRNLWYDFILFMLPILVIFFCLYTVFSIWEKDEKISTLTALSAYTGLIFTAIILHGNFRRQHEGSAQLLYLEYLFFMLYITFIMFVLYAMLKLYKSRLTPYFTRFFSFYRIFFWPIQLAIFMVITIMVFYTE